MGIISARYLEHPFETLQIYKNNNDKIELQLQKINRKNRFKKIKMKFIIFMNEIIKNENKSIFNIIRIYFM